MNTHICNGVGLVLAFFFVFLPAWFLPEVNHPLSLREAGILAAVLLAGMTAIDFLSPAGVAAGTFLTRSLLPLLAGVAILLPLAWSQGLFAGQTNAVLAVLGLLLVFRYLMDIWISARPRPAFMSTGILLLGDGPSAETARNLILESNGRYRVVGRLSLEGRTDNAGELADAARRAGTDMVVVAFPERRGALPVRELMLCRMQGMAVLDMPAFYERAARKLYIEALTPGWFAFAPGFRLSDVRHAVKRASDVVFSLIGLVLTLPFLPFVALCIKRDSPGPIFFLQERVGLAGRPFTLIKLRTMRLDAERETGARWAGENDPRITRTGRFLRKTRLDELPQLVNVLLGEMSLIGPRPERPEFVRELEQDIPFYSERHCVKPGITGWAQVRYRYGASVEDAAEKLRFDLYYAKNQSVLLDAEIVLRTFGIVLSGSGAR